MATLPRQAIDAYTERLNSLSRAARETVAAMLSQVEYQGIADLREQVIEVMEAVCGASSDAASALAADFYDEVREAQTGAALGAEAAALRNPEATAKAVRALVQIIVDGRPWERFVSQLQDRADYEVKRSAGECVKANAARDPLRPKWARVPSGSETCGFCLMLASRGFAYASERSASEKAEGGHYHPNCDCRIVPGFEGMDVEGYDPDELYRQWREGHKREKSARLVTCAEGAKPLPKERKVAEFLAGERDWRIEFVKEVNETGVKTADAYIDGELWEFKVPEKWNEKTIKNQFKKALGKGTPLLLISGTENGVLVSDMEPYVDAIFGGNEFSEIGTVMLVGSNHAIKFKRRQQ